MTPAIQVSDLEKRYPTVHALRGVSLAVEEGEFFGLLGPNGAGKTTLISILAGLTRPTAGEASVMGHDVVTDYRNARRKLGVVPQEIVFDPFFSVRETLRIQSGYFGLRKNDAWVDELLEKLHLTEKANANMRQLSGGMKRRVLVAQALVHRPPVIILDEPTAGVDVELRQSLWQFIRELNHQGHTIILTTHYLEEAETLCGRIAMLKNGQIVALDSTRNLLAGFSDKHLKLTIANGSLPAKLSAQIVANDGDSYTLALQDYSEVESVLAALREAAVSIVEMKVEQPDLEDVFVKIMGRQ
ncbi:MAG TPA: ABC transporter ATP-binding protein [Burkholderiales bacterium]|nr:ABC transporter ATP-binding protein [Burkholderiales bacterium]